MCYKSLFILNNLLPVRSLSISVRQKWKFPLLRKISSSILGNGKLPPVGWHRRQVIANINLSFSILRGKQILNLFFCSLAPHHTRGILPKNILILGLYWLLRLCSPLPSPPELWHNIWTARFQLFFLIFSILLTVRKQKVLLASFSLLSYYPFPYFFSTSRVVH